MSGYFHPATEIIGKVELLMLGMQADSIETTRVQQVQATWMDSKMINMPAVLVHLTPGLRSIPAEHPS